MSDNVNNLAFDTWEVGPLEELLDLNGQLPDDDVLKFCDWVIKDGNVANQVGEGKNTTFSRSCRT